jgi:hypothetical protein
LSGIWHDFVGFFTSTCADAIPDHLDCGRLLGDKTTTEGK